MAKRSQNRGEGECSRRGCFCSCASGFIEARQTGCLSCLFLASQFFPRPTPPSWGQGAHKACPKVSKQGASHWLPGLRTPGPLFLTLLTNPSEERVGLSLLTGLLAPGRQGGSALEMRRWTRGPELRVRKTKRPQAKECGRPPEAGKDAGPASPRAPPGGASPGHSWILAS